MDGEWSVEKVLQVIVVNCRSWRGDGIKVLVLPSYDELLVFDNHILTDFVYTVDVYPIAFHIRTRESS